jgi:protein involved in polysaccharide export with SLBB domain
MDRPRPSTDPTDPTRPCGAYLWLWGLVFLGLLSSGCAALTNPVADGVRVRDLPPELRGESREARKPIPLFLLRMPLPPVYRLDAGDILGVWIEGILGERNQPVPVHLSDAANTPPLLGFPIPVREDGTVLLPLVAPVTVRGMSIPEAHEAIRLAYTAKKQILQPGRERIFISLQRSRQYNVLVVREDGGAAPTGPVFSSGITQGPTGSPGNIRRGTGAALSLSAYENDVLTALARTGGLPGLDAANEVVILRGARQAGQAWPTVMPDLDAAHAGCGEGLPGGIAGKIIRIPLRLQPGEPIPFRPEDVVLHSGDIVFIQARDTEVFYTGGLLPPAEHILPRDYDLDVVEAIARVRGPLINGGVNQNNFTGQIFMQGLGFPSPSLLTVLRKTRGGGQVIIRVDLNQALRDPRERVLVQPGDMLILQDTIGEAFAQYLTTVLRFNFLGIFVNHRDALGTATLNVP